MGDFNVIVSKGRESIEVEKEMKEETD